MFYWYRDFWGGWMICHFSNIKVHFVFCQLKFIVLFLFLIKYYHIFFIIIVFWLGCDRPSGLLLFVPAVLFSILTPLFCVSSSVLFHSCCSHAWVFGKTLVHEFPVSYSHILNGTSSFLSLVQENINMPSGHYYRLCSWSGRLKPSNEKN